MIALRPARPGDAGRLAAIFSASRRLIPDVPTIHSEDEDRRFLAGHVMATQDVTVAERAGAIVGFVAQTAGWIHHIYVAPDALGRGTGTALLRNAMARAPRLDLWCFCANTRARRFYERHGFVAAEFTDGSTNEAKCADVRYRWSRLPDG